MDEKSNRKAGFGSIEDRIRAFRDRMAPALHLFPQDIAEKLTEGGFFTAPASTKYHGAYEGGLFDHSRNVISALVTLTHDNDLEWQRPESPYIIGMFHDICKQDQYRHPFGDTLYSAAGAEFRTVDESRWEYEPDTLLRDMVIICHTALPVFAADDGGNPVYPLSHGRLCGSKGVE